MNSSVANLGGGKTGPFSSVSHTNAAVDISWFPYSGYLFFLAGKSGGCHIRRLGYSSVKDINT